MVLRFPLARALPVGLGLLLTAGWALGEQERGKEAAPATGEQTAGSIQDALNRPYHFTFAQPTPLQEVAAHLGKTLRVPVALDRAALDRLELKADDPVVLELEGVRLKTGLKLLLDQLDLTFKVVAEDNLLVITDAEGSREPFEEILAEIKSLHRELHDVQDRLDDVRGALGLDGEAGAKMRKPTILEEVPAPGEEKGKAKEPAGAIVPRPRSGL